MKYYMKFREDSSITLLLIALTGYGWINRLNIVSVKSQCAAKGLVECVVVLCTANNTCQ